MNHFFTRTTEIFSLFLSLFILSIMPPKRQLTQSDKKEEEVEIEVIDEIQPPKLKKLFVADPNKQYKMTAAQWACPIRSLLVFSLCEACMTYFKECGGSPNVMLLCCSDCTIFNHRLRFPSDKPLQPLPSFVNPIEWNKKIDEMTKNKAQ